MIRSKSIASRGWLGEALSNFTFGYYPFDADSIASDDTDDDLCQYKVWQRPDGTEYFGDVDALDTQDDHRLSIARGTATIDDGCAQIVIAPGTSAARGEMTVTATRKYSLFD